MNCRICDHTLTETFPVKEMIFGIPGSYEYGRCGSCGCVQLLSVPDNLGLFYPADYYSLKESGALRVFNALKKMIIRIRDQHYFGVKKNPFGYLFNRFLPGAVTAQFLPYQFMWEVLSRQPNARIHDVGCGNGILLKYFAALGFENLSGNDPFLKEEIREKHLHITKKELEDVEGAYEAILMNHVLEHTVDPKKFLHHAYGKLQKGGRMLVRIPMADSAGFERYRENWVGMEAPRHIHLFTQKSFALLAATCNFRISRIEFDCVGWHYMVSEGYKNTIFLKDQSHPVLYTPGQVEAFENLAAQHNKEKKGDTCAFYLEKI